MYLFKIDSIYSIIPFLFFHTLSNNSALPQLPEQEIIDDTSDWIAIVNQYNYLPIKDCKTNSSR